MYDLFVPIKEEKQRDFYSITNIDIDNKDLSNKEKSIRAHSYYEIFRNCSINLFDKLLYTLNKYINNTFKGQCKFTLTLNDLGLIEENNHGIDYLTDITFYKKYRLSETSIEDISKHCASILYNSLFSYIDYIEKGDPYDKRLFIINRITNVYKALVINLISVLNKISVRYII